MAEERIIASAAAAPTETTPTAAYAPTAFGSAPAGGSPRSDARGGTDPVVPSKGESSSHTPAVVITELPQFADYEVLECIGEGGFGIVYKARDRQLQRLVALKVLRSSRLEGQAAQRFQREAQAMAQLDHPGIVPIYAQGNYRGQPFFAMKLMTGGNLADRKRPLRAEPKRVATLIAAVARAVHYLHERKYVHRDIKPKNILFSEADEPYITDFGVAKLLEDDVELTNTGEALGTLPYMAPEQIAGRTRDVGPATDVWALGVVLHEVLVGERPFASEDRHELRARIATHAAPPLKVPGAQPLGWVVARCLAKKPRDRYATALDLAEDLERWVRDEPVRTPRPAWRRAVGVLRSWQTWAALAIVAAGLTAAVVLVGPGPPPNPPDPVASLQSELRAGRAVQLLNGPLQPRWSRWRLGEGGFSRAAGAEPALAYQTFNQCILELLPDPGVPAYRLRAELRHDQAGAIGDVGVVFGLREQLHADGKSTSFQLVAFHDLELQRRPENRVTWSAWVVREIHADGKNNTHSAHRDLLLGLPFAPARQPMGTGPWRTLEIEVRQQEIKVRWDGRAVGAIDNARFQELRAVWRQELPALADLPEAFPPPGGVGLWIDEGEAAFRKVLIEPLSGGAE